MEISLTEITDTTDRVVIELDCDGLKRRITADLTQSGADPVAVLNAEITEHVNRARRAQQHRDAVRVFVDSL